MTLPVWFPLFIWESAEPAKALAMFDALGLLSVLEASLPISGGIIKRLLKDELRSGLDIIERYHQEGPKGEAQDFLDSLK